MFTNEQLAIIWLLVEEERAKCSCPLYKNTILELEDVFRKHNIDNNNLIHSILLKIQKIREHALIKETE